LVVIFFTVIQIVPVASPSHLIHHPTASKKVWLRGVNVDVETALLPLQFQSFSQYRCKTAKKSDEEIEFLRNNPKIWNVHSVLNVLHSLVDKSNINRQLEVYTSGGTQQYFDK